MKKLVVVVGTLLFLLGCASTGQKPERLTCDEFGYNMGWELAQQILKGGDNTIDVDEICLQDNREVHLDGTFGYNETDKCLSFDGEVNGIRVIDDCL